MAHIAESWLRASSSWIRSRSQASTETLVDKSKTMLPCCLLAAVPMQMAPEKRPVVQSANKKAISSAYIGAALGPNHVCIPMSLSLGNEMVLLLLGIP